MTSRNAGFSTKQKPYPSLIAFQKGIDKYHYMFYNYVFLKISANLEIWRIQLLIPSVSLTPKPGHKRQSSLQTRRGVLLWQSKSESAKTNGGW